MLEWIQAIARNVELIAESIGSFFLWLPQSIVFSTQAMSFLPSSLVTVSVVCVAIFLIKSFFGSNG